MITLMRARRLSFKLGKGPNVTECVMELVLAAHPLAVSSCTFFCLHGDFCLPRAGDFWEGHGRRQAERDPRRAEATLPHVVSDISCAYLCCPESASLRALSRGAGLPMPVVEALADEERIRNQLYALPGKMRPADISKRIC
jgi:hypothetical protein